MARPPAWWRARFERVSQVPETPLPDTLFRVDDPAMRAFWTIFSTLMLLATIARAVAAFVAPPAFVERVWPAYVAAIGGVAAAGAGLAAFIGRALPGPATLAAVCCQAAALIVLVAGIYRASGPLPDAETVDTLTALHFSIVTWTTLGSGDLKPLPDFRLLAAFQALVGYVFLGVIVGLIMMLVARVERQCRRLRVSPDRVNHRRQRDE
jgi:hypothetical protein